MTRIAICGALGRMGTTIANLVNEADDLTFVGGVDINAGTLLGAPVVPSSEIRTFLSEEKPDVLIDFTIPASTEKWLAHCRENKIPMVIGTTGLSETQTQAVRDAAADIPVLHAANMSLAMNLLFQLVARVAQSLDDNYDIEIVETHHRFKRDAPSGTALELARQIAAAKPWPFPDCLIHGREGKENLRQPHTIGMHAIRAGDTVGIHQCIFSCLGETLELKHTAHTRDTFVRGALYAARFLARQPKGFYSMCDALGLE